MNYGAREKGELYLTNYLARIFYLGMNYHGSQWQPNVRTVQGAVVDALAKWCRNQYPLEKLSFSGRTDKGVTSIGQIICFESDTIPNIDKINSYLPEDIVLWAITTAPPRFSPRYSVLSRHYRYFLDTDGSNLNLDDIRKAAKHLIGTHNYALLSKPDNNRNTLATILNIAIKISGTKLVIDVYGTRFLWKLVRKIVSLLKLIGENHYPPDVVLQLLEGRPAIVGGIRPAPAEGLVLVEAVTPLRMKVSKNAVAAIRKKIFQDLLFHKNTITTLDGIANNLTLNGRLTL